MDHLEFHPIMVGVALDACSPGRARSRKRGVKTLVALNLIGDFAMAIEALERGGPRRNLVALHAVRIAVQVGVRFCERPRRNLRGDKRSGCHE